ncbi:hypothetical protein [Pseudoduganella danionis]|uniref:hypothetical protein n=1 Tax=Pseudoduganella danionis TaxID=1890295 RepID=UPI0035B42585
MKTNDAGMQSPSGMHFSDALLAQALTFVRLLEHAEGGLISAPEVVLQIRFGFSPARSLALATQLEKLGCWSIYVDNDGQRKAQVLYR